MLQFLLWVLLILSATVFALSIAAIPEAWGDNTTGGGFILVFALVWGLIAALGILISCVCLF